MDCNCEITFDFASLFTVQAFRSPRRPQDDNLSAGRVGEVGLAILGQNFELAHEPKHFVALFDFFDR